MSNRPRGCITRDEIAEVAGLLCARSGAAERAYVQATTINGEYENPIALTRAWVEVREVLEQARKDAAHYGDDWQDHMPNRPDLFDVEYHDYDFEADKGEKTYTFIEDYDEAEDRRVALQIMRAFNARFRFTIAERNSL